MENTKVKIKGTQLKCLVCKNDRFDTYARRFNTGSGDVGQCQAYCTKCGFIHAFSYNTEFEYIK